MNYRDYIADTTCSSDRLLDDWRWLTGLELQVWQFTKAGDAFLKSPADGSIHFLDVAAGSVEQIAQSEADFEAAIEAPENAMRWLLPAIVDGQAALGMRPGPNECLSFRQPPVLGGQLTPDNLETCAALVHFSIAGQIHQQVKDLPNGAKIGRLKIRTPAAPDKRPWWKFW